MPLPFYPFYWADYSSKTFNLTQGQHGAYMLCLRHLYATGEMIPDAERYTIGKAMDDEGRKNIDSVLEKFFIRDGDNWTHERVKEVMKSSESAHKRRVTAGKAKGKAKKAMLKQCSSNAPAMLKQPESEPEPEPEPIKEKKDSIGDFEGKDVEKAAPPPTPKPKPSKTDDQEHFEAFWQAYPRKVAKGAARKAWASAVAKTSPETVTEAAKAFARQQVGKEEQYIAHPATWLNAERWQDDGLAPKTNIPTTSPNVFVTEGSPAWLAWIAYRKEKRFPIPNSYQPKGRQEAGAFFPSEFPPGHKG